MATPTSSKARSSSSTSSESDADDQLTVDQLEETINQMRAETAQSLSKLHSEQVTRLDLVTTHLDEIKRWCLTCADTSELKLVAERAEVNAQRLVAIDEDTQKMQENSLESLKSALLKAKSLAEQIHKDANEIDKERETTEALQRYRDELKKRNKETNHDIAIVNKRLKEIRHEEMQEATAEKTKKLQMYSRHLKEVCQQGESRLHQVKEELKEAKEEFEELERKKALKRRVTEPTSATRAAAKRRYIQHVFPSHQEDEEFNQEQEPEISVYVPPSKSYHQAIVSPSKKIGSIVMVPAKQLHQKKAEAKDH
ncbi:hypothetical protein CAEBREN_17668 [Caenorhabditis brenneri]|uniref:Uncharacterized protein n=1 Tax=Caenorhabditis brenneri TaxID=135651 RepID=G0MCZ5_CAEBE|nr:hypothetical protein CAEBREN_17668 [Caenorhabditis brenneri]